MNSRSLLSVTGLLSLFLIIQLSACSEGNSGDGNDNSGAATPFAPVVPATATVSYEPTKVFRINWTDVSEATYYRVLENPDGSSGYSQVSGDILAGVQTYAHVVTATLYDSLNASYILQSCNSHGCNADSAVFVSGTLVDALGYVGDPGFEIPKDEFGYSLSLSNDGNTLAVGAPNEDSNTNGINTIPNDDDTADDSGAAYVFVRSGSNWSQHVYFKASNTGTGDSFGTSVSLSGDGNTLAVGAPGEASDTTGINTMPNDNASGAGAVYVFTRSGDSWSQQAYIKASNTGSSDGFGTSVSLSDDGNTLAVGADYEDGTDDGTQDNSGAVYVFTRTGESWDQQRFLKASNIGAGDRFGTSVSLNYLGDALAVGAPFEDSDTTGINSIPNDNALDAGAVYLFSFREWLDSAYIKASNTGAGDNFGASVSLRTSGGIGDTAGRLTLAVGAPGEDSNSSGINSFPNENGNDFGAVYAFFTFFGRSVDQIWAQQAYIKPSVVFEGRVDPLNFGTSVSLTADGNTLAAGAPGEDSSSTGINSIPYYETYGDDSGAAYVFHRIGNIWSQQAYLKSSSGNSRREFSYFGKSVSLSGNDNDLAVGAPTLTFYGTTGVYLY